MTRTIKRKRRPKCWGDISRLHIAKGRDHADAAYRADSWLAHKKKETQ